MDSKGTLTIDQDVFKSAAQVTVAFLTFYMGCVLFQGLSKLPKIAAAKKKKLKYDRYQDPSMRAADRMVGNILEWMPIFLGLFWISMIITGGATVQLGWAYLASRILYAVIALNGGINVLGAAPVILLATVPAYAVLTMLLVKTAPALL